MSYKLNIKLIRSTTNPILYVKDYIKNGENLEIKPIDSSLKNKCIAYCPKLPFGIYLFLAT